MSKKQLGSRIPLELFDAMMKKAEELNMNQQEATEAAIRAWVSKEEVKNPTPDFVPKKSEGSITPPNDESPKKKTVDEIIAERKAKNPTRYIDLGPEEEEVKTPKKAVEQVTNAPWMNVEQRSPYAADNMTDEELGYGKSRGKKSILDVLNEMPDSK